MASDAVPVEQRCVWPGCTRRRAPGRASGSGRQKEYCLLADPPEGGGGPVHNARNRWAVLRGTPAADGAEGETGGEETGGLVPPELPFSLAKERASALLEQARRQHAAVVEGLRAERELYQRLGEQLTALSDPASLDLEIAAITSRAGRDVAQAAEEAARARRAQLAAERERDDAVRLRAHADAAAEQLAADAEAAEQALAAAAAEFDRDREALLARAGDAERQAARAAAASAAAKAAADAAVAGAARDVSAAHEQVTAAREQAREEIAAAQARADESVTEARQETAASRADAERERTAAQRARDDAERTRQELTRTREELTRELDEARDRTAAARAGAATADARAAASAARGQQLEADLERIRDQSVRRDGEHAAELVRLEAAHRTALDAERARAARAEADLDALRA